MGLRPIGIALLGLLVLADDAAAIASENPTPEACPAAALLPAGIRVLDCGLATVLTDGLVRSATLHQLVQQIDELNGLVFVRAGRPTSRTQHTYAGALYHRIAVAGHLRLLHVAVVPGRGDDTIVTVAHEFQHVVEVLEHPDARDESSVDALFERIGHRTIAGVFETDAALEVSRTVRRELSESRSSGRT